MQLNNSSVRGFNLGEHWSLDNYIVEISGHSQISGGVCLPSYVGKQTLSFRTSRGARGQYLSYHATYHGIGQSPKPSMLNYDGDSAEASNNHHRARKIEWRLTVHFFLKGLSRRRRYGIIEGYLQRYSRFYDCCSIQRLLLLSLL